MALDLDKEGGQQQKALWKFVPNILVLQVCDRKGSTAPRQRAPPHISL